MLPFTDLTVAANNCYLSRDGRTIDMILLHTMVGTWQSANGRFNNAAAQVSAHRGICWDGIERRWVEDEFTAYHAGDWEINLRSLSIEHEDMGDYNGVRPDIVYSMSGAQCAEWAQQNPAIKLDRFHIVPGVCDHRDIHATACPDALDTDRIIWIARKIYNGGNVATFDPRNNTDDLKFLDDRYASNSTAEAMKNTYNPVAAWWRDHGFGTLPHLNKLMGVPEKREPDTNMKGTPPAGHPAHDTKAGFHTPGKEENK
jgi:hypothetical protein